MAGLASAAWWNSDETFVVRPARSGLVRGEGQLVLDDDGAYHPVGLTLFWSLFGYLHEKERIAQHQAWLDQFALDYTRNLCEVDWAGRSWGPDDPQYQNALAETIDDAYRHGRRSQLTLIGGQDGDALAPRVAEMLVEIINDNRAHKIQYLEVVNEWSRLDKMSKAKMITVGRFLRNRTPCLVALSAPTNPSNEVEGALPGSYEDMLQACDEAGANCFVIHPRRADHDHKWAQVRQMYDCASFDIPVCVQEGVGPGTSVRTNDSVLQLSLMRLLTAVCGGFYTQHVGQAVTGVAQPALGRPENLWDVPNITEILRAVCDNTTLLPERVEHWKVVNNSRADHPLKLDKRIGVGFWEGNSSGSVNKNYAAISGSHFVETLLGVKAVNDTTHTLIGRTSRACHVVAFDLATGAAHVADLKANDEWHLPGRVDTMAGYFVIGQHT